MPSLTPEEQEKMLGPVSFRCPKCNQIPNRNYCKGCDEFFFVCGCPVESGSRDDHNGHRTY